jgi:agarase
MRKTFVLLILIGFAVLCCVNSALAQPAFFTTGYEDGRWWLLDTQGNRFFSTGVCVTDPDAFFAPDLGYTPYYENIMDLYGDEQAWADETFSRLQQWNFNTLGAWSDIGLLGNRMPYTVNLGLAGADWELGTVPDYFSDQWMESVDTTVATEVTPYVDEPNVLGWFLDNELRWGADWRGLEDMFALYFVLAPDAPGKIALVDFLRDRYSNDLSAFNAAWEMSLGNFDDLLPQTQIVPFDLDPVRMADRQAFTGIVAEQFFSVCHAAIRAVDTNHLILGTRFVSWVTPRAVVEAGIPYLDVISVNHYEVFPMYHGLFDLAAETFDWMFTADMLADYYETTNKPVLITEFSIRALDTDVPSTWPPNWFFHTVQTQAERADFFEDYARQTFAGGFVVGYHWFSYMDEPPEGRFDGENSNFGLVDNFDTSWQTLTDRMTLVNGDALTWPIPDDDDDDDDDDDATADDDDDDDTDDDDDLYRGDDDDSDDDDTPNAGTSSSDDKENESCCG